MPMGRQMIICQTLIGWRVSRDRSRDFLFQWKVWCKLILEASFSGFVFRILIIGLENTYLTLFCR